MSLLVYTLIVFLLAAVVIVVWRSAIPEANLSNIGALVILVIAVLVVAQHAGVL